MGLEVIEKDELCEDTGIGGGDWLIVMRGVEMIVLG